MKNPGRAAFIAGLVAIASTIVSPCNASTLEPGTRVLWLRRAGFGEIREAFTYDGRHYDRAGYAKFAEFLRDVETDGSLGPIGPLDPLLIDCLWEIQRYYRSIGVDAPIDVYSAFRTPLTNAEVGGKSQSYHLGDQAADIGIEAVPMAHLAAVSKAIQIIGGVGTYVDHVHIDTGPQGRRW